MNHNEQLVRILEAGARAYGFYEHARPDGTAMHSPKAAATAGVLSLRDMQLVPQANDIRALRSEQLVPAGKLVPLSAALVKQSRVAAAGSAIIVHQPAPEARPTGSGEILLVERPRRFTLVEAAPFSTVPDGTNIATTPASLMRATLTFAGPSYGVSHSITRADISQYGYEAIASELLESIAFGLARACDHALLSAIAATDPEAFSIGAASSAGLEWSELRSFVGTEGAGAVVAADGALRAAGIPATLTSAIASTVAGSFSRAAIGVMDDLRVAVERRGTTGGLVVTAWADIEALLPNPAVFWSIA